MDFPLTFGLQNTGRPPAGFRECGATASGQNSHTLWHIPDDRFARRAAPGWSAWRVFVYLWAAKS